MSAIFQILVGAKLIVVHVISVLRSIQALIILQLFKNVRSVCPKMLHHLMENVLVKRIALYVNQDISRITQPPTTVSHVSQDPSKTSAVHPNVNNACRALIKTSLVQPNASNVHVVPIRTLLELQDA